MGCTEAIEFDEMIQYLQLAWDSHQHHAKTPEDLVRRHDDTTPYFVHPAWAAMSIMQEPSLPLGMRWMGFRVLTLHDVLEDTTQGIPEWVPLEVRENVKLMSFGSLSAERKEVWSRSESIRLFKLYDKASNLLDGAWMDSREAGYRQSYEQYASRLAGDVERVFGELNICRIVKVICKTI